MGEIAVLPEIPRPSNAAERRLHKEIHRIVKRITLRAACTGHDDLLFAIYVAGLSHGAALTQDRKDTP